MNNLFLSTSIHTSTKFLWPKRRIRVTIGLLNAGRGAVSSVLIYGDDFLVEKAFGKLVTGEGLEDLVESNCHRFTYPNVTLEQLKLTCDAMPFLSTTRLVIIKDLLKSFESRSKQRNLKGSASSWEGLSDYLRVMPESTELVFIEGPLRSDNWMLKELRGKTKIENCLAPRRGDLAVWIRQRVSDRGSKISPSALRLLIHHVGMNLRALDGEIEKLTLFAGEDSINEFSVTELVTDVREASIFAAVDAVVESKSDLALRLIQNIRTGGAGATYILSMLARQLRLVTLAKELHESRTHYSDIGGRLKIKSDFVVQKTVDQAKSVSWKRITFLYDQIITADRSIKQGTLDEDLALELFVTEAVSSA